MALDQAGITYAHRTAASAYRVPTPPRITVPPPTLNNDLLPDITLSAHSRDHFLSSIDYENLISQNASLEWKYERRREAQMILPYLYLGPMTAAKDEAFLKREGITCILGIRPKGAFESKLMNGAFRKAEERGLEWMSVDLANNQELISSFSETSRRIYDHVLSHHNATENPGKVLVFCESGNERSAAVVAAYVMSTHEDVDFIKAMQLCQAQRFCVNFDDGMKRLLQGYWDILCAEREVATQKKGLGGGGRSGQACVLKRSLERDEDEDDVMGEDDVERFGGRKFVPFVDETL